MANPYELRARESKITRIVDAMDAHFGHFATVADLQKLTSDGKCLTVILAAAKVRNASQETVDALVARIQQREDLHARIEQEKSLLMDWPGQDEWSMRNVSR